MSQKVFIFDLDGLLVDSEPSHFKAYRDILASYGVFINRSEFIDGWLSGEQYGMKLYLGKVGISDPGKIALIRAKKKEYFLKLAKGKLRAMSGVKEFLEKALADGIKCGVGTGAYHEEYNFMLEQCGLASYFSRCVGGDEVIFNKPAPDIFLGVADYFGVCPSECLVFENSSMGLTAAKNAKMKCVIIPSEYTKEQNFFGADRVVASFKELEVGQLRAMVECDH